MKQSWFANRDDQWPPPVIQSPDQMVDGSRLAIWCTQTQLSASAQRALVRRWCQVLPTLRGLEHLWFHTRVPQALFDAACEVPGLKSLNVKWSGIKSVAAIEHATSLQYLRIGSSTGLESIEPLGKRTELKWLGLENIKRITKLDPLTSLTGLEGLIVEGSMWTTQIVETLAPIAQLPQLRYLGLANLRAQDRTLAPLFPLRTLQYLVLAEWWPHAELVELYRRNPGLRDV